MRQRFPGLHDSTRTEPGDPAERICEVAADEHADTIVVGNRGVHGNWWRVRDSVPEPGPAPRAMQRVHRGHAESAVRR